jgi:deoxyribodipyrimidine photolyase-related protein
MAFIIFPHQLYSITKHLNSHIIYLIEEPRFFSDFKFHKLKLAYHRATMKKYYDKIKKNHKVIYVDFNKVNNQFYKDIKSSFDSIHIINPGDHKLLDKMKTIFSNKLIVQQNINFLINDSEINDIKKIIFKNKKYSHNEFYKYQRRKLDILIKDNKPVGGKWSYDTENRLPLPKNHTVPKTITKPKTNKYIKESINYINKNFPNNYGSLDNFIYPIDSKSAKLWLNKFLDERLGNFGKYEDAVSDKEPFVYHSVISPMMNIGILTDTEVVKISYDYYQSNTKKIPIQSFEGFIRQVIGWRNYVYTVYLLEGDNLRNKNFLKHHNSINNKFWESKTGILPIDSIIDKIVNYSYAHHIERLMYLGNFMLLCFIDPKDVYKIFMEWTIDAYDWVMVPNVFGMSQYADGGMMMTRPYFSSSNYINKMSTYKKDGKWDVIWDSLYYNFINKHQDILRKNYATAQQVKHWDNKSDNEQKELINNAKTYLKQLL